MTTKLITEREYDIENHDIKFRGMSMMRDHNQMIYGSGCYTDEHNRHFILTHGPVLMDPIQVEEIDQFVGKKDKFFNDIYVNDILKMRVDRYYRGQSSHYNNINHSKEEKVYYLYAQVLNTKGQLRYNEKSIDALREPRGRERSTQYADYDTNLFSIYSSEYIAQDKDGKWLTYMDGKLEKMKRFIDIEIVSNMKDKPELINDEKK